LAIAWAVAEFLHDLGSRGVPTLFATHYHELVELEKSKLLTKNYNVSVKKWSNRVVFLRKLVPGGVNRSYGLAVANLAGLPKKVLQRAEEVLADLTRQGTHLIRPGVRQESLFSIPDQNEDPLRTLLKEIEAIKTDELSPRAALDLIAELKDKASEALS
jgi:DNA mismatch repair protein MutS